MNLFDYARGADAKTTGMALAADANMDRLALARRLAAEIASRKLSRECNADEVGREMNRRGFGSNLGPAAGSLFKGGNWEFTGRRIRSSRVTNHARELKVWRYVGAAE
tara:strand:- start:808 stop:1131 length:324 start_codon:yes stop_codon:yes gene_type:complete